MTVKEYTWAGNANSPSWPTIYVTKADYETLAAELAVAQQTNREWLAANAPGGWIDNLRKGLTAETNCEEVMPDAGNSTKPDHVKPGVASGDNTPQCFFCARPLESHYDNAQGHPWRRGSRVTVADLAINRQTETACGEKPPIGFGVPTLADRVKAVMAETGAGYESALQTVAEECELRSEAIFAVRQYFDYYEPEQKNG